jgi:hypothetical protein
MTSTKAAVLFLTSLLLITGVNAQHDKAAPDQCAVVESAFKDARNIRPGSTRADVERAFVADGGLTFPSPTRYVYRKCEFLKLDVEFQIDPNGKGFSPSDVVTGVSKLYVDYPHRD